MPETVVQPEPVSPGQFGSPSSSGIGGVVRGKRQQKRAGITREKIVDAAARQFDACGFAAASINSIIEEGNLTKGAIYFHFSSKEQLAQQVIERWSNMVNEEYLALEESGDGSPYRQLVRFCSEVAHHIDADPLLRAGLLLTVEPSVTGGKDSYTQWRNNIDELVVRAIDAGEIKAGSASYRLSDQVCATFIGGAQLQSIDVSSPNLGTRIADVFEGLSSDPGQPKLRRL
ncbi:TetR/AcrR family transcriptional regulator [Rhodococcus erythropolis]|uniref:TetR/AcrR family transcriptional regulator n=1 Tax=Rhodococcus erythropolis TaxID=1833 RepID=UPI001BEB66C2|nr:TetR/AcrR family transcriptional regulator [Rhodococcus erythropolis]MBT2269078.1 TetR/AcrR family transcriptional regulator [Rhodococcus erythropolis]